MVDWKLYAWVKRSKQRQRIVKLLEEPQTPTDISEELDVHIAQVSHSLSEMQEHGLVEVLNPEAKTGRLYRLTETGNGVRIQIA